MGASVSFALIRHHEAIIHTHDKQIFEIAYHALVEHIFLLRKVIQNPKVCVQGVELDRLIQDYCQRMASGQMRKQRVQETLPWEIEWIWHVHRLHPIDYLNDCKNQLRDGLVDKQAFNFISKNKVTYNPSVNYYSLERKDSLFSPSIDLSSAIIRQRKFLENFQKHALFSYKLHRLDELTFENLIQTYVSFIKLAKKNQMIVPTFDIDLIWHTHMRHPSDYHKFSKALCGFILNHDDDIESSKLTSAYSETADRWKQTYQTDYGKYIDRNYLEKSLFNSSCAMVQRDETRISEENENQLRLLHLSQQDQYNSNNKPTSACGGGCASCGSGGCGGCGGCGG